ncbi:MAG: hypothetical protein KIS63_04095 [Caldilineales bacterium]|nr:hypothetical protein [Caldilineales bacterium]
MTITPDGLHDETIQLLLHFSLGGVIPADRLEQARAHLLACTDCWQRFGDLARALADDPDLLTAAVLADLRPAAPNYAEWRRLQTQAPQAAARLGRWQRGRDYLAGLSQGIHEQTQVVFFALQDLRTVSGPALAHRSEETPAMVVLHCDDLYDFEATVTAIPYPLDADRVRLEFEISIPSRWPDFSGVRVVLDDGKRQTEQISGRSGIVAFDGISRADLPALTALVLPPS